VYRIEQTPQRHGSGPLGVRRGVSIFTLDLSNITSADFFLSFLNLLRSRRICPGYSRRREGALARNLTLAVGF
jgi:hypothetical protein